MYRRYIQDDPRHFRRSFRDRRVYKAKQNIDTAIFTINTTEKPLFEVADFLEMFVPEVKVPESFQDKSVILQVGKKTMKEIILVIHVSKILSIGYRVYHLEDYN